MQVILQEDYASLGFVGDVVKVKDGFARNYLFPQKIALPANKANVDLLEHRKRVLDIKKAKKKEVALQYKDKVEGLEIKIQHAVSEGGRLFGSVTLTEIHYCLVQNEIQVDKKLIRVENPIRQVGEHFVDVKLHQEVVAKLKIIVEAKEEAPEEREEREAIARENKKASKKAASREKSAEASEASDDNADKAASDGPAAENKLLT
ncbi:MAG: 50S ribosomal protein L9 [Deltaproteobacteria bacterium]|nr:50S ribosomal protein L9 [Deltaproteobacteria bacterium]